MKKMLMMAAVFAFVCACACSAEEPQREAADRPPQDRISPRQVQVDSNFDGKIDRTEVYDENGQIAVVEADANSDGKTDGWVTYENGKPSKEQRDSNGDGKPDVWIDY